MNTLLVICGLTATGKTSLAGDIAQLYNGEIISIDSRQAYQYMDIGTGKDVFPDSRFTLVETVKVNEIDYQYGYYDVNGSRIWLYDTATPDQPIHVALYYTLTWKAIQSCWEQHKLPILVGGDGFYLQSILHPPASLTVLPNLPLRAELEQLSIAALQERLSGLDATRYQRMNESDRQNPRRLIRAIEVAENQGDVPECRTPDHRLRIIGLTMQGTVLRTRIQARVQARLDEGFEQEISTLLNRYPDFYALPGSRTLGYQQWRGVVEGALSKPEATQAWINAEIGYAKRQLTWFKKRPGIQWLDVGATNAVSQTRILLGNV